MISAKSIILNAMKDGQKINFISTSDGVSHFDLNLKFASLLSVSFTDREKNFFLILYDDISAISTGFTVQV
jgi:hypothetical protein